MKLVILLIGAFGLATSAFSQYQPTAIWQREGAGDSSLYGSEILALGDQNDDGFKDWAVFALGNANDTYHGAQPGYVEFFHGGNPPDTVPYMVRSLDTTSETALWRAQAVGDLNGDRHIDWMIKVQRNDGSFRNDWKVYSGGTDSLVQPDLVLTLSLIQPFGGDFNGDGYDDVVCTNAWGHIQAALYGGALLDTIPDWSIEIYFGSVHGGGDLNHDGFADFVCYAGGGAPVRVFLGGAQPDTFAAYSWNIASQTPTLIQDINGDGFDDLCFDRSGWGQICLGGTFTDTATFARLTFPCYGGPEPGGPEFIASAGDFNHDGFGDIVMGTGYCPDSWYGTLTLHLGGLGLNPEPAFIVEGWTDPFNLIGIKTVANLGDINGDHFDDLAVGANDDVAHAAWRGKVVILAGDTSLHAATNRVRPEMPNRLDVSVYPNPFNSTATVRLDLPPYAQDVRLTLYNILGQSVRSVTLSHPSRTVSYPLDASDLSTGLYLLQATSANLSVTTKLVVLR